MARILSAGRDPYILKCRNAALSAKGHQVVSPGTPHAVNELLSGRFDLLVLDDSVPHDDVHRLAEFLLRFTPATTIIVVPGNETRDHQGLIDLFV